MNDEPLVKIAKALADPTRLRMLRDLREAGELTCSCVCDRFALSQPTISHHVRILIEAGLIRSRRDGPYHRLTVNERVLAEFTQLLAPPTRRRAAPRRVGARLTRTKSAR
jgi:ArsR family transcriptional regulator